MCRENRRGSARDSGKEIAVEPHGEGAEKHPNDQSEDGAAEFRCEKSNRAGDDAPDALAHRDIEGNVQAKREQEHSGDVFVVGE